MDDAAVAKQIEKLVRFILREAEEKANDIMISAEEVPPTIFNFLLNTLRENC